MNMDRRSLLVSLVVAGCATAAGGQGFAQAVATTPPPPPAPLALDDYKLGAGDKIRILVYNEPNLSGEFLVNAAGVIAVPLIGDVTALSRTVTEIRSEIEQRLGAGYLRAPQVSIDVLTFRPFYILGEVNKPGDYPYSAGLNVLRAVATANGYTYRADKRHVYLKRAGEIAEKKYPMSADLPIQPGDTVRIGERYF
jgi:protein involved in polysaccharide export with SLBB domain